MGLPQRTWHHGHHGLAAGQRHLQQGGWQPLTESLVDPADAFGGIGRIGHLPVIDSPLHLDMGPGLELQVPLLRYGGIVVVERPLDID
jgi:hypothetical protein